MNEIEWLGSEKERANRFALEVASKYCLTSGPRLSLFSARSTPCDARQSVEQLTKISVPLVSKTSSEALALNLSESCPNLRDHLILAVPFQAPTG